MKFSLLIAASLAFALSGCGKKEEATAASVAPIAQPPQVATAPTPVPPAANEGAISENPGSGLKLENVQATASPVSSAPQSQQN